MTRRPLHNFLGCRVLILHPPSGNMTVLSEQLKRLGVQAELRWPVEAVSAAGFDLIFFDADRGYDGLFGWPAGQAPVPLIALMGSEAPGRIQWALAQMPSAYLVKPLGVNGIFSALAIAFHDFAYKAELKGRIEELNRRMKARPSVLIAINLVQASLRIDPEAAYELLRSEAMNRQITVETLCAQIAQAGTLVPLRDSGRPKPGAKRPRTPEPKH